MTMNVRTWAGADTNEHEQQCHGMARMGATDLNALQHSEFQWHEMNLKGVQLHATH